MKMRLAVSCVFLLTLGFLLFIGCSDDDKPTSSSGSWRVVFEDNFDGDTLNTSNWTQINREPGQYSLTGSGELEIGGDADSDGPFFFYNTAIPDNDVRVTTKFRTTQKDSVLDDIDLGIILNYDVAEYNAYSLDLISDTSGSSRDYELVITKLAEGSEIELRRESMGGETMPQIIPNTDYIMVGSNSNGTITITIKDGNGNALKSISINDSSYSGGQIGIYGDCNIGTSPPQSIFYDYVKVETYK